MRRISALERLRAETSRRLAASVCVSIVVSMRRAGRLRVTEVIALSPAAIAGNIKAGDYLLAVDGRAIDQAQTSMKL